MNVPAKELARLNFYRASELYGGLVLGRLAQCARDPSLILRLTQHSAEEVVHAQLWTETIIALGGRPSPVRETYQSRLAAAVGIPRSVYRVLALTQVFERRVYRHFLEHERRPGCHPIVRATLRRMVHEEKDHLSWVKEWLEEEALRRSSDVRGLLDEYSMADERVYRGFVEDYGFRTRTEEAA